MNSVSAYVPELMSAVKTLTADYRAGGFAAWPEIATAVRDIYSDERMAAIETKIPGWQTMASYDHGQTLIHVNCVFICFYTSTFGQFLSEREVHLLEWAILAHDLAKMAQPGERDLTHAFRSTVIAARLLPLAGFPTNPAFAAMIDEWAGLTATAVRQNNGNELQDNRKLPRILAGFERLFGKNSEASMILKTILFHHSFSPVPDWPNPADLSDEEIEIYIDLSLWRILGPMLYVDSDAWQLFDEPQVRQNYARGILNFMTAVENKLAANSEEI